MKTKILEDFQICISVPLISPNPYLLSFWTLYPEPSKHLKGCSYGGELVRLGGLARLGEMIFIPRSYGIFHLSSIKKFFMALGKDCLIK